MMRICSFRLTCMCVLLLTALVVIALIPTNHMADTPKERKTPTVSDLVKLLGDRNYRTREKANLQLKGLGKKIVPQLRKELKKPISLEARLRVEKILELWSIRLIVYTNQKEFVTGLKHKVHLVDFDDVKTNANNQVAIKADRYSQKFGIHIKGQMGQMVSQSFNFPKQFQPQSGPNMYAPGPIAPPNAGANAGGHETRVTFKAKGKPAAVAGFGCYFIDADYPKIGPCSLAAYNKDNKLLGKISGFNGGNGSKIFRGIVARDGTGELMSEIARVEIINGSCWVEVDAGEGVTLDDFVFGVPILLK